MTQLLRVKQEFKTLVNQILDKIPQDKLIYGNIFDPEIGGGQFMIEVERRKRAAGLSNEQIEKTCFGFSTKQSRINYLYNKYKVLGSYIKYDILQGDIDMQFDVVVGNPPYQGKNNNTKIWPLFVAKSINDWTKADGKIGMITPVTWCSPTKTIKGSADLFDGSYNRLWDYFQTVSTYADTTNVGKYFKGIGSSFGYFIIDKSGSDGLTFADEKLTEFGNKFGIIPNSRRKGFYEGMELCNKHFDNKNNIASQFEITTKRREVLRVQFPRLESFKREQIEITNGPYNDGIERIHVYVNTMEEANKIKNRILEAFDIITFYCRYHSRPEGKIVGLLRY